jgi:hypothetical protein
MYSNRFTLTIFTLATALSACGASRKAAKLDRPTALEIMREAAPKFLKSQEPVYDAKTQELILREARGWDDKRGALTIAFLDALASVGILRDKKINGVEADHYDLASNPRNPFYTYQIVPQEGVNLMYANTRDEVVLITLGKRVVKEILGIRQEGSDALVDVSITNAPTPLYDKITEAAKPLFAQCGPFPDPKPYFCGRWPSRDGLTTPEKFTYRFSRYDDGWRLVTE